MTRAAVLSVALAMIMGAGVAAQGRGDAAAAAAGPGGGPHANVRLQMTVDGMNNGNPTPILAFQLGASNTGSASSGGGAGAGKVNFSDLNVSKILDGLSVPLLKAVSTGEHIKDVKIELFDFGANAPFATYTFTDVLATSDVLGSSQNQVSENVSFNFARIASTVIVNGLTFNSCFDAKANAGC